MKPNFFIIGAPKCGTTSLTAWLAEHPQVWMSPQKEPHFFSGVAIPPERKPSADMDLVAYERLFAGAGVEHVAVGEASTSYLLHADVAVPAILSYSPKAKFVVCLRNPIQMAISLHRQRVFDGEEDLTDFADAWAAADNRRRGFNLPRYCIDPEMSDYPHACLLGRQVEALFGLVDRRRVLVLLLDDMRRSADETYRQVLRFLDVEGDSRGSFPVLNEGKERRSRAVNRLQTLAWRAKRGTGIRRSFGVLRRLDQWNRRGSRGSTVDQRTAAMLRAYFREDVERLGSLIGRDLSGWIAGRVA